MKYYLTIKKKWHDAICRNMDAPRDYHTKCGRPDRERQIPYDIIYMWNLKYDTNEIIYESKTDSQTQRPDLWLPRRKGQGAGMDWESGISRCTLVYTEWINNKFLLCSTGRYIQYIALVTQSCPALCDPMDCSLVGSSVHGILQARVLEWIAIPFFKGSSQSRDQTLVSCIAGRFFTI